MHGGGVLYPSGCDNAAFHAVAAAAGAAGGGGRYGYGRGRAYLGAYNEIQRSLRAGGLWLAAVDVRDAGGLFLQPDLPELSGAGENIDADADIDNGNDVQPDSNENNTSGKSYEELTKGIEIVTNQPFDDEDADDSSKDIDDMLGQLRLF